MPQRIWIALLATLVLGGCTGYAPPPTSSTPPAASSATTLELAGSAWTAAAIDGVGAMRGNWPQLRWVSADRVAGTGGCNAFVGSVEANWGALRFGKLAATGKLCMIEPGGQEDKFFRALELTRRARRSGSQLLLLDESGNTLVTLERLN